MNFLKVSIASLSIFMAFTPYAAETPMTPAQEKAQRSVYFFLDKEKFKPEVDSKDNSVCFRQDGILYWITFSDTDPMLYTLHRKGYKVGNGKDLYKRTPATIAANEINLKHPGVKATVSDDRVSLTLETYAATPQDYNKMLLATFKTFQNVDADFKAAYKEAFEQEKLEKEQTVKEITDVLPPSALRNAIKSVSFRLVDDEGKPITEFNEPLRAYMTRFIQPGIELNPWSESSRECVLYFRIIRPDGELICIPGTKYSAKITLPLEKSKKPIFNEVNGFVGSDKEGFWKAGEYKFEVLDAYDVIYETTFNLL